MTGVVLMMMFGESLLKRTSELVGVRPSSSAVPLIVTSVTCGPCVSMKISSRITPLAGLMLPATSSAVKKIVRWPSCGNGAALRLKLIASTCQ